MHIAFLNPQGNFDPNDSYWTEHPDFGGQLVYVKEICLAMAAHGHKVDILTRRVIDDNWPEFSEQIEKYKGHDDVRIVRIACGPDEFLPKEELWPYLGTEWVDGIIEFYEDEGGIPDFFTAHYADGALSAAVLQERTGVPFTMTGHSLGAQKMDKLDASPDNLKKLDDRFHFARRILGERMGMNHAARIITSTRQEQMEQYSHVAYRGAVDVNEPDGPRFAIIPPGVNRTVFSPEPEVMDAKIKERIQAAMQRDLAPERQDMPLVVCSSRLDRKKNHMSLVKAFVQSAELRDVASLAIVVRGLNNPLEERGKLKGEDKEILDEIVALLEEHGLRDVVTSFPLNNQAELASAYRVTAAMHSCFGLTANYEPFGLAPLEAMSAGLPAVVTKNGGPSESMYDSDTEKEYGVLVDPANPDDVAKGILKMFNSWQQYHEAGIERIITRYTWDRTAENYLKVIKGIHSGEKENTAPRDLEIPEYFTNPTPENDITLETLSDLYFGE